MLAEKVTIFAEYADFANIFLKKSTELLPEHTGINENTIIVETDWQPPYKPIYCLTLVKLETVKTYIMTNQANDFICLSKSPAGAPILFVHKPNSSLVLCIND